MRLAPGKAFAASACVTIAQIQSFLPAISLRTQKKPMTVRLVIFLKQINLNE
jgi:hypothetical protein